jgi:hypothetical protein
VFIAGIAAATIDTASLTDCSIHDGAATSSVVARQPLPDNLRRESSGELVTALLDMRSPSAPSAPPPWAAPNVAIAVSRSASPAWRMQSRDLP